MVKTVMIDNSTHRKLEDIQTEIKNLLRIRVSLGDIVDKIASDNPKEIAKRWFKDQSDESKDFNETLRGDDNGVRIEDIKIKGIDYDVPKIDIEPLNIKKIVYPEPHKDNVTEEKKIEDKK